MRYFKWPFFLLVLCFLVCLINTSLAQTNLFRNPSFEDGVKSKARKPDGVDGVKDWYQYRPGVAYSSDWFIVSDPTCMWGIEGCGILYPDQSSHTGTIVPAQHGSAYVGTLRYTTTYPNGENLQTRLYAKLSDVYYTVGFWYYPPCSTHSYAVKLFLDHNKLTTAFPPDHFIGRFELPDASPGWHYFETTFLCPRDNYFDHFILMFDGTPFATSDLRSDGAYLYYDSFSMFVNPCTNCFPHGPIAWNQRIPLDIYPNFVGTRDYDSDWFCIKNINNATHGVLEIRDAWGHNVSKSEFWDPSGSVNAELCWDGTDGGVPVTASSYFAYVELDNCDVTNNFIVSPIDLHPNPAGSPIPPYPVAPNYIPAAFGEPDPPNEPRDLYLYGGAYTGGYVWRACHDIYVGDPGNEITPYWIAGSGSLINLEAGNAIHFMPGHQILAGATVNTHIDPTIQCCPALRISDSIPGITPPMVAISGIDTISNYIVSSPEKQLLRNIQLVPNPFKDNIYLRIPEDKYRFPLSFTLFDMTGQKVLQTSFSASGEWTLPLQQLPAGIYRWVATDVASSVEVGSLLKAE